MSYLPKPSSGELPTNSRKRALKRSSFEMILSMRMNSPKWEMFEGVRHSRACGGAHNGRERARRPSRPPKRHRHNIQLACPRRQILRRDTHQMISAKSISNTQPLGSAKIITHPSAINRHERNRRFLNLRAKVERPLVGVSELFCQPRTIDLHKCKLSVKRITHTISSQQT